MFARLYRTTLSLRSKRFRRFFRPFEAFFAFWRAQNFFALAPSFARSKSEKCFKPAESPTETLASQAIRRYFSFAPSPVDVIPPALIDSNLLSISSRIINSDWVRVWVEYLNPSYWQHASCHYPLGSQHQYLFLSLLTFLH